MARKIHDEDSNLDKPSFEQTLNRLDETVQGLETGGLSLAEATGLYEEGLRLARLCSEMLSTTELRISRIRTAYGEQMRMMEEEGAGRQEDEPC